uniref:RRM domain-containing protein n=2 Tax=Lutzomyia longipalpis TaxID=7200 RepID=A0A1B0CAS3_LUTLO
MTCNSNEIKISENCAENSRESMEISNEINLKYPTVQINGCRQFGPPQNFSGPPPAKESELFICRIPKGYTEIDLLPILERFGTVHQFRLMMDYNNQNRGYGYVLYQTPDQATRALELIPHFITHSGAVLDAKRSYDKCRLFVGNLPKEMDCEAIKSTLKMIYPEMCNFIIHTRPNEEYKNRGFAFIDFPNHQAALRSKKKHGSGSLKLWDRLIKVVWAKEERIVDPDVMTSVRTLFIRNIDLSAKPREFEFFMKNIISKEDIVKVHQVRDFAFVEFTTRQTAVYAHNVLSQKKFSRTQP